jgi:hypothetical protein
MSDAPFPLMEFAELSDFQRSVIYELIKGMSRSVKLTPTDVINRAKELAPNGISVLDALRYYNEVKKEDAKRYLDHQRPTPKS